MSETDDDNVMEDDNGCSDGEDVGEDPEREVVDFGWNETDTKPVGGRRLKKMKEEKKKLKSGTFGKNIP